MKTRILNDLTPKETSPKCEKRSQPLREPWLELEHARELETISSLLDAHPKLSDGTARPKVGHPTGRERCWSWGNERGAGSPGVVGEAAESVHLSGARFTCRLSKLSDVLPARHHRADPVEVDPSRANIKAVKFETLEQINRELVSVAEDAGIEKGRKVRVDCTVVESNIHPPTASFFMTVFGFSLAMCRARELLVQ